MAGGVGFVRDAQNRASQNRDNLKNKSNFVRTYKNKLPTKKFKFKEVTSEELERFRPEFLKNKHNEYIRTIILTTLIIATLTVVIAILVV